MYSKPKSLPVSKATKQGYVHTLDNVSRDRYLDKLRIIDNFDPYEATKLEWTNHEKNFPSVLYPDIVNYLIFTKSHYTMDDMKAWKSLDAYNQLTSGWISDVAVCLKNGYHVVKAKVLHSQRLREKPLLPWIIAEKSGTVRTAHCDCMAGLGEACTHIATLLFAIDATVKIRDAKTVTQEPAYWLLPSALKEIRYRPVGEMDFTSAQTKRHNLDYAISTGIPVESRLRQPKELPAPSAEVVNQFLLGLSAGVVKPVILSIIKPFSEMFIPKQALNVFPDILTDLFQEELYLKPFNIILDKCRSVEIKASTDQIVATETATRGQANSRLWYQFRAGRVTASNFKKVCRTDQAQPSPSLIKNICYPGNKNLNTPATRWGRSMEDRAKMSYYKMMEKIHINFHIKNCGFVICKEHPQIGASPDGLVSCDCCGDGCLEVKCPYVIRNKNIKNVKKEDICLIHDQEGNWMLDRSHDYFYQIQCQLFVCERGYGDFFLWTTQSYHCERIYKDETFWPDTVQAVLYIFKVGILPELLAKYYTRIPLTGQENAAQQMEVDDVDQVWCFCREGDFGDMVACDSKECKIQWFHFGCVGILMEPKGKWYCPECRKKNRTTRMLKR